MRTIFLVHFCINRKKVWQARKSFNLRPGRIFSGCVFSTPNTFAKEASFCVFLFFLVSKFVIPLLRFCWWDARNPVETFSGVSLSQCFFSLWAGDRWRCKARRRAKMINQSRAIELQSFIITITSFLARTRTRDDIDDSLVSQEFVDNCDLLQWTTLS